MMVRYLLLLIFCATTASAQFAWRPITIPMRDGKSLAADLYTTDSTIAKPVVLVQTPYNKNAYRFFGRLPAGTERSIPLDTAAFNYVIADWRGFYGSTAAAVAGYDRGLDGYDAVEWIAQQRWNNGRVGTWGPSALGQIQFLTARHQPQHLVCAVPMVKDFKTKYEDYYFGGEFRRSHVETLERLGFLTVDLVLQHPTKDIFWRALQQSTDYPEQIAVPMLLIGGWFDHFPDDVLRAFDDIRHRSAAGVREEHRLIFGPWTHSGTSESRQGELEYPNAERTSVDQALRFLQHHLLNADNGWSTTPRVRYYQLGANEWRSTDDWSALAASADTTLLSLQSQERLVWWPDSELIQETGKITFDPRNPSPTHGGSLFAPFTPGAAVGPYDQRAVVESRSDALIYTSDPLAEDLDLTGPISALLTVISDREDTDFAIRLTDVHPDGRSMLMAQGIRRLRFRNGFEPADTALAVPGSIYNVKVDLQNLAITFRQGHRIRIIVTSSNYPHFDVNPNTGAPLYQPTDSVVANNQIITAHGRSHLLLPVRRATSGIVDERTGDATTALRCTIDASGEMLIHFSLPKPEHVTLEIYDLLGRRVATLVDGNLEAGRQRLQWNAPGAGIYLVRLRSGSGGVTTVAAGAGF